MESKSTALLNITTRIQALTLAALIVLAGGHSLLAQPNLPGDGSDGPLNVTSNTVIDLGQAVIGGWADNNAAYAGKGIYDPSRPVFVFKYSSVKIAQGATVSFANWPPQVPVVWWVADTARQGPEPGSAGAQASSKLEPQPPAHCRQEQSARIANFGDIRADCGGSMYLIAPTIENRGTISVTEGRLSLLAGEQAAISRAGEAGGSGVCVSQPNGAVANTGKLMADGGAILIQARNLDQEGAIQADSSPHRSGKIELVAADSLRLGPASCIFARGNAASLDSPGGNVTIKSGNAFADVSGSRIEVGGGALGGNGGHAEICAPRMPAIRSIIVGQAAAGFANGELTIDPLNILLVSSGGDGTSGQYSSGSISYNDSPATGTLTLDVNAFSSTLSQIHLEAVNNIELSTVWTLSDSAAPAALTLTAGNSIILDDGSEIDAGNNWSVNLTAGTEISPGTIPAPGAAGVYLNGSSYLQTMNGDITVLASNEVIVSSGAVRTEGGGNITIAALAGDVNSGTSPYGFDFGSAGYTVDANLGGISTAAGGNVNITAGSDVVSFLPPASGTGNNSEAGAGAFGAEPGNVSLTAGHDVLGHFVLRDGSGKIQAGNNAGETANPLALSLVSGSWTLTATQNVNLQEVRNPNGMFNAAVGKPIKHYFDYAPQASVSLAAHGIYLLGGALPRLSGAAIPALYPPILNISAGGGGANLGNNVTLFPSPDQSLVITTTDGGNLTGSAGSLTSPIQLFLSDSAQAQWASSATFTTGDHGSTPPTLNDPNPLTLDISGSMENLNLIVSAAAAIVVAGDMTNCGFSGQNLSASEVTSITVGGRILNQSAYIFANDVFIPEIPSADVPGVISSNHWDTIFRLALNPSIVANLTVPANLSSNAWLNYALQQASLFGVVVGPEGQLSGSDEGFVYNSALGQLAYGGPMSASLFAEVSGPFTILHLVDGIPVVNANGHFETDSYTWVPVSAIQALYAASQADPSPSSPQLGYRLGGPGQFEVSANSISLGNTAGILSCGVADPPGGFNRYSNLAPETSSGAALQVSISGNLDMLTSTMAAIGGGDANVTSSGGTLAIGSPDVFNTQRQLGFGIFTSGSGNVSVTAFGDIDLEGSRIAAFNGGNVFIESYQGSINAGGMLDGLYQAAVPVNYVNSASEAATATEEILGCGILAATLVNPELVPDAATVPGNITVLAPQGNITANLGGILQEVLGGTLPAGPAITLAAGAPGTGNPPGGSGNIDLGTDGVFFSPVVINAITLSPQGLPIVTTSVVGGGAVRLSAQANVQSSYISAGVIVDIPGVISVLGTNLQSTLNAPAGTDVQLSPPTWLFGATSYQWFEDGVPLTGATNAVLTLTNLDRADAGIYSIADSGLLGAMTNNIQLHVQVPQLLSVAFQPATGLLQVFFSDADGGLHTAQDIPTFVVQTSTNLVDWSAVSLTVVTNANGKLSFTMPVSTQLPSCFFRIQSQ